MLSSHFQDAIQRTVGQLWENILDEQRFAILKEKGALDEVVKSFSENLHNDVFALENQVRLLRSEYLDQSSTSVAVYLYFVSSTNN